MPNVVMVFFGKSRGSNCFVQNWLARENCDRASLNGISFFVVLALRKEGIADAKPAAARLMNDFFIKSLLDGFIFQVLVRFLFGKMYKMEGRDKN
jgi:hypothetical protein